MNFDLNLIMYKIKSYDMVQMFVNCFVKEKKRQISNSLLYISEETFVNDLQIFWFYANWKTSTR